MCLKDLLNGISELSLPYKLSLGQAQGAVLCVVCYPTNVTATCYGSQLLTDTAVYSEREATGVDREDTID